MIKLPLTKREEDFFAYILGYIVDNNFPPTRKEIADHFNISVGGAQKFVSALCRKNRIRLLGGKGKMVKRNIVIRRGLR